MRPTKKEKERVHDPIDVVMPLALATWPPGRFNPNAKVDPRVLRSIHAGPAAEAAAGGGAGW